MIRKLKIRPLTFLWPLIHTSHVYTTSLVVWSITIGNLLIDLFFSFLFFFIFLFVIIPTDNSLTPFRTTIFFFFLMITIYVITRWNLNDRMFYHTFSLNKYLIIISLWATVREAIIAARNSRHLPRIFERNVN